MGTERTFSVLGDSISTYAGCNPLGYAVYYEGERASAAGLEGVQDTWWAQVVRHFGGRVLANASYSGSLVEGGAFPAGSSAERVAALAPDPTASDPTAPSSTMPDLAAPGSAVLDSAAPDVVLVFMGINDYGWGGAAAQADGLCARSVPARPGALEGFADAYRAMLERVRAAYPEAEVWCLTLVPGRLAGSALPTFTWNLRGVPLRSYNEAIAAAAREAGCHVADLASFGLDYEAVDGTHPTKTGMAQLAAMAVAAMEGRAEVGEVPGGALASEDFCPDGVCAACPWPCDPDEGWNCVCVRRRM